MIPLFKPYMPANIMGDLENILYSWQLSYGKYGKSFEEKIAQYINNPYVLTINSYHQAMLVALTILGLKSGDAIIASPVSCLASNQPFVNKGLEVIWADIDPQTGALCVDDVKSKITSRTKAIFHNHFCGYIGDVDAINQLARQHGLWVVDDCIEAFGSTYQSKQMGDLGTDITVFSFQTVRLPNTIEGAALAFNSKELYEKAKLVRDYGIERQNFRSSNGEINPDCDIKQEGYGATLNEINSYIGTRQMDDIDRLLSQQNKNAIQWQNKLASTFKIKPLAQTLNSQPNYWVYGILCEDKEEALASFRQQGWYASSVHINNNIYSVFANKIHLKGVNDFMDHFLALPCGWWVEHV